MDSTSRTLGSLSYTAGRRWKLECNEPHGGSIRRWLVSDGLALHVRFGMMTAALWKAQATVARTWVGERT